eukprot:scaffold2103_cov99-Skeletonema_dohrnii-CCMP3373.AAC.4
MSTSGSFYRPHWHGIQDLKNTQPTKAGRSIPIMPISRAHAPGRCHFKRRLSLARGLKLDKPLFPQDLIRSPTTL